MLKSIFYHLDYNYRPWNHTKSVPIMGVAGFTAGRELHPALKTNHHFILQDYYTGFTNNSTELNQFF